jgi:hypothetical protein
LSIFFNLQEALLGNLSLEGLFWDNIISCTVVQIDVPLAWLCVFRMSFNVV